jgi:hypothetical protein
MLHLFLISLCGAAVQGGRLCAAAPVGAALSDGGLDAFLQSQLAVTRLEDFLPPRLALEHRAHQHFLVGLKAKTCGIGYPRG